MSTVRAWRRGLLWVTGVAASCAVAWWGATAAVDTAVPDGGRPIAVPSGSRTTATGATMAATPEPSAKPTPARQTPRATGGTRPGDDQRKRTPPPSRQLASRSVTGGSVTVSLGHASASLVAATPAPGFQVRTWQQTGWLRVDFVGRSRTSSVFVTWNGHPPLIQTYES